MFAPAIKQKFNLFNCRGGYCSLELVDFRYNFLCICGFFYFSVKEREQRTQNIADKINRIIKTRKEQEI